MSPIRTAIADASTWILATANPAMSPAARATATWPVMPLESALSWCAFYAVIVSAGLIRKSYEKKGAVESDASSSTLDAVVKQVQIVYNFVQVRRGLRRPHCCATSSRLTTSVPCRLYCARG